MERAFFRGGLQKHLTPCPRFRLAATGPVADSLLMVGKPPKPPFGNRPRSGHIPDNDLRLKAAIYDVPFVIYSGSEIPS